MKKLTIYILLSFLFSININAQFEQSLSFYADKCDSLKIGTSLGGEFFLASVYDTGRTYDRLVNANFNALVAGNDMKFDAMEPQQGVFNFTNADLLVAYAEKYKKLVRGHTLLWHEQLPSWINAGLTNGVANGTFTRESLQGILKNHISTIVTHFKGRVQQWDVANEVFDDGTTLLRNSIWKQVIGDDYIDSAFVWAHRADPSAKLYLNDYSVETMYNSKSDKMYNYIVGMQQRGIPIHGAGMQSHFICGSINFTNFDANFKRYNAIGLECIVTELDIRINKSAYTSNPTYWLATQAEDYRKIVRTCLDNPNAKTLMLWGFTDKYSWIPGWSNNTYDYALIFDYSYAIKPAYTSMLNELAVQSGYHTALKELSINRSLQISRKGQEISFQSEFTIDHVQVYDIQARCLNSLAVNNNNGTISLQSLPQGMYILKVMYADGTVSSQKFFN